MRNVEAKQAWMLHFDYIREKDVKSKHMNKLSDVNENKTSRIWKYISDMENASKMFFVYLVNNKYWNFGNHKYFHLW